MSQRGDDYMKKYEAISQDLVGVDRWNAIRQAWTAQQHIDKKKSKTTPYTVDVDTIVEHLVNPKKPAFAHPVPLPEMVNILMELWEADGLFD
ncbi:hypothetical protein AKO1_002016 [Acrasis kona]|uniref:DUF4050 domain-containing protein n=1 Tax=Acrasis kona TaxID=1008807 RepID=A0AAW2Z918_9EUKA